MSPFFYHVIAPRASFQMPTSQEADREIHSLNYNPFGSEWPGFQTITVSPTSISLMRGSGGHFIRFQSSLEGGTQILTLNKGKAEFFVAALSKEKPPHGPHIGCHWVRVKSGSWKGQLMCDKQGGLVRFPELLADWLI